MHVGFASLRRAALRFLTGLSCAAWLTWAIAAGALADVGDPTVRTDHPHYPGEGAFQ